MSAVALQRILVRMLYDPAFADAIYAGTVPPEISAEERAMLVATPRAAWEVDPYRRSRSLHALIDEYPVSAAVAGLGRLDAFFSSPIFHRAIQGRQRLALIFGSWVEVLAGPVAAVERTAAEARRDRRRPVPRGKMIRAPGFRPVRVPNGTLARLQEIQGRLGADPLSALLRNPAPLPLGAVGPAQGWVLAERRKDGSVGLGDCSEPLGLLLAYAGTSRERADLLAEAGRLGADPGQEAKILEVLVRDGLLIVGNG